MKNTKRSIRRHHYSRIKANRINKHYWGKVTKKREEHESEWCSVTLGISVNTPQICSQPECCGNQRKVYGKTRQELKSDLSLKEWS